VFKYTANYEGGIPNASVAGLIQAAWNRWRRKNLNARHVSSLLFPRISLDLPAGHDRETYLSSTLASFRQPAKPQARYMSFDILRRETIGLPSSRRALILRASKLIHVEYGDMRSSMRSCIRHIRGYLREWNASLHSCTFTCYVGGSYSCQTQLSFWKGSQWPLAYLLFCLIELLKAS